MGGKGKEEEGETRGDGLKGREGGRGP